MMPEKDAARKRVELDQGYLQYYPTPATPPPFGVSLGLKLVAQEAERFGDSTAAFCEGFFESRAMNISRVQHPLPDVLRGLMWRGRHQSIMFQMFMQLCLHGLCTLKSLERPTLCEMPPTPSVNYVMSGLLCSDGPNQLMTRGSDYIHFDRPDITWEYFMSPLAWLAIMITRTTTSLYDTLNFINSSRHLGNCSLEKAGRLMELKHEYRFPDPNACVSSSLPACFGFMLPSGINLSEPENDF